MESTQNGNLSFINPLVATVATLPEDILLLIFQIVCHDLKTTRTSPTDLSHVCKSWRATAIGAATLWTSLLFTFPFAPTPTTHDRFSRQKEWIRRSSAALLDVVITENWKDEGPNDSDSSRDDIEPILKLLQPHSYRWRLLHLTVYHSTTIQFTCEELKSATVPFLESFKAEYYDGTDQDRTVVFPFQSGCPKLVDVALHSENWTTIGFDPRFIRYLSNVKALRVLQTSFGNSLGDATRVVLDLIRRSPRLSDMRIEGFQYYENDIEGNTMAKDIVVAAHLANFEIEHKPTFRALLPHLQLPALIELPQSIHPLHLPDIYQYNPFPNLRVLVVLLPFDEQWSQPLSALPPLLSRLDMLEHLRILWSSLSSEQFDGGWLEHFSTVCPSLRILNVDWRNGVSEESVRALNITVNPTACGINRFYLWK